MTTPIVSIIIPCYNKRAYVGAAVESALAQGEGIEVIVIDDGSTDGSLDVVSQYKSRIVLEVGPNRGGSAARNRGLALANGKFIQFLDADDLLPEGKIQSQLDLLLDAEEADIAFCPWSYFHDDGQIERSDDRCYWQSYDSGLNLLIDMWTFGGFFPPHTWLMSRSIIDKAGFWDEALTGDDDGEFFARILVRSKGVHFVGGTYVLYRDPPEGAVSRDTSLKSAHSFWAAFRHVATEILTQRSDRGARRAVLSRLRKTAYAWRDVSDIVDRAAVFEKQVFMFDLSPSLPMGARWLVGLLGIRRGLQVRRMMKA